MADNLCNQAIEGFPPALTRNEAIEVLIQAALVLLNTPSFEEDSSLDTLQFAENVREAIATVRET